MGLLEYSQVHDLPFQHDDLCFFYPYPPPFFLRDGILSVSLLTIHILFITTEHKYEIVRKLQERKHICGMTGDGVNDAPALKRADIGIAVADATDAARGASDIVLTEPGLSVIISAVLTSRAIFQRMKNYTVSFCLLSS
jgi:hypothetical protein